jgi:lysophospholipid acyltransferase (LPLAT)-like uncharacterized protein
MRAELNSRPEEPAPPARPRRKSGVIVPHSASWPQRLGARVVYGSLKVVSATLRYRWEDHSGQFEGPAPSGPAIYCVWHNRLALCLRVYFGYIKKRNCTPGLAAMVSASRDGGFLARILECFKVQPVRGSTSRRGPQALLELTGWAERGYDLALTPDGPRGPRYIVQEGVMSLAQLTGLPIVPVSYSLAWKIHVKSWDGFLVPLPFSGCAVVLGRSVRVPREASDEQREALRRQLEEELRRITKD